jgi:hypothetical protein
MSSDFLAERPYSNKYLNSEDYTLYMASSVCEHRFVDATEDGYSITELDIGAARATSSGYGRLTIRHNVAGGVWEVYDLGSESVVNRNTDLEQLVDDSRGLTEYSFKYEHDRLTCRR